MRLIRPLSRDAVPKTRLAASHWQIATEEEFTHLWFKELQEIPPTRSSEIHLASGLLLPVWKHLPGATSKVYRLQTDDGERIVGRLIRRRADSPRGIQSRRGCQPFAERRPRDAC